MFAARVSAIIINFGATWKQAIDSVNREVMSSFPSFRTGGWSLLFMLHYSFYNLNNNLIY